MTAIEALKYGLTSIQQQQAACVTEAGMIKSDYRYEYQALVKEAKEYRQAIEFLENMRKEG